MAITSLYTGILGLLYFIISIDTIKQRRRKKVYVGSGSNNEIIKAVSAHNNFASYVPILLIQLGLLEQSKLIATWQLHTCGAMFSLGRLFHYIAFRSKIKSQAHSKLRIGGMIMTFWPLVFMSIRNLFIFL